MSLFLFAWALCMTVAAFVVVAVVVALEVRDRFATVEPATVLVPLVREQRSPVSAAAIVPVRDVEGFEEFLGELIVTPHVEEALR